MSGTEGTTAWWRDAVVYEVYVRGFADGDGDGVGDLPGARARLPYLAGLGVDAVWLTPFYRSPMADGGYDVADHRDVDPLFGDLADLDALVADAHALGLRVLVDVVPNHSSVAHPWFAEARAAAPGSPARARYVFRPGRGTSGELPPNNWRSDFGGPAWTRLPDGEWYLHLFAPEQADFDWSHPDVGRHFEEVLRFWLDRGVDGFRIDVAHGLVKDPALPDAPELPEQPPGLYLPQGPQWDQPGVHEVYRAWRRVLDGYPGERTAIGEAWVADTAAMARYVRPDELHQVFDFAFLQASWTADALRAAVIRSLAAVRQVGAPATWVLNNHDVSRTVTRFGGGAAGLRRARAAALLMLALPGSTYLYQGEELGLPDVDLPDDALRDPVWERSSHTRRGRDGCRVPLPWSRSGPSYGFGPGAPPWLPVPAGWGECSVEAQTGREDSTLELYRHALALRRRHLVPAGPDVAWVDAGADVLALRRGGVLCVVNLGPGQLPDPEGARLLLSSERIPGAPDTAAWWALP
ncbi:glycoside hydrolase family 13 protein [Geodermatophilus sp. SYSU D00710]